MTTEIRIFDRDYEAPDNLVEPSHDPLRSAFVPYSTGLLMNEMKSYMEWMSYRRGFSWMNSSWYSVDHLYDYWPYLENAAGVPPTVEERLGVVCLLVRSSQESFQLLGVVLLESTPTLDLALEIETRFPSVGATRYNMALVPMELVYGTDSLLLSALYWWWKNGKNISWREKPYTVDSMLFWISQYRVMLNKFLEPVDDPVFTARYQVTMQDVLKRYGVGSGKLSYHDPLLGESFMSDLRNRANFLSEEVTVYDIYRLFSGLSDPSSIGLNAEEHLKLRAILCLYPDDIQERLLSGVVTSVDPNDVGQIGAGLDVGNRSNRAGDRILRFESVLQPRPESASFTR